MATQPKIPEDRERHDHAKVTVIQKRREVPWLWIALLVAAAMLAAIIFFLPRAPKEQQVPSAAHVPQQPTGGQIQLTDLNIAPAPQGGALYLYGRLHNTNATAINGVRLEAQFRDASGNSVGTQQAAVEGLSEDSQSELPLTDKPIQPAETRPFRAYFAHPPQNWNRELPELRVVTVTAVQP